MNRQVREWLDVLLKTMILLGCMYLFLWPFRIDGSSMEGNFYHNDRIAISRVLTRINMINRGDCVICEIHERGETERIIKRVIGKPGDSIRIEAGLVYLNGELLDEPYISYDSTYGRVDLTLADDEYFVMGDNRNVSYDSRSIGPIKKSDIVGKVIIKWYPFNSITLY